MRGASSLLALVALLCGCANLPPGKSPDPQDPFERFNRASLAFNDTVDRAILNPVAKAYRAAAPEVVRTGIGNFFGNLSDIATALNDVLQGRPKPAGVHVARVAVNSTIGLLGLIDVATGLALAREREDFGQTLGVWGFGSGPYVVLPLLGPSSVRDSFGLAVDRAADPLVFAVTDVPTRNTLIAVRAVDNGASLLAAMETLDEVALDRYLLLRDVYLARRRSLIDESASREPASSSEP